MGKFKKQQDVPKHEQPIIKIKNNKITKNRNKKLVQVEVKNKKNLELDSNLIKKVGKNMITNNNKMKKNIKKTVGITKSINTDNKSKIPNAKKNKKNNSTPVKINSTNAKNLVESPEFKKKFGKISTLNVMKADVIKIKKAKTVEAPTPEPKKFVKKAKTVQAPTPEPKIFFKKPKNVEALTPDMKKQNKGSKTIQAPLLKIKKQNGAPKAIQAPPSKVKKLNKISKIIEAPTREIKKQNKTSKTIQAPSPEAKKQDKNSKIIQASPEIKKQNTKIQTVAIFKSKKPKTVLAPTPPPKKKSKKNALQTHKNDVAAIPKRNKNQQNELVRQDKKLSKEKNDSNHTRFNTNGSGSEVKATEMEVIKTDHQEFDQIVTLENVEKTVNALNKVVKEEISKKKQCIFSDYRYMLNIACFKIPDCPKRTVKLQLKHCLVGEGDDVVFIVKDLKRGAKLDYEPTIHHWEDQLRVHGITGIKAIVPFNQLKKEYTTYEMKLKFCNMYEHYLCDAAITGHVVSFLGKPCSQKTRSTIFGVRTNNLNILKTEINKSLLKTSYYQGQKGNMISIAIGTDKMDSTKVSENLLQVVEDLKSLYVGGIRNIRNMHLRINLQGTSALPIYICLAEAPSKTPNEIGPREQRLSLLKNQADKILSKFSLTKSGELRKLDHKHILLKRAAAKVDTEDSRMQKKQRIENNTRNSGNEMNVIEYKINEIADDCGINENDDASDVSVDKYDKSDNKEDIEMHYQEVETGDDSDESDSKGDVEMHYQKVKTSVESDDNDNNNGEDVDDDDDNDDDDNDDDNDDNDDNDDDDADDNDDDGDDDIDDDDALKTSD